jgi:2-polyprenyl-3-methyl-5-hydroxy-6-metoxy-1,4-benzoquinol methylase
MMLFEGKSRLHSRANSTGVSPSLTNGETSMVDQAKLDEFLAKMLNELGGAMSVPMVRIGDMLGLYKVLHNAGPMTAGQFCAKAQVAERYAREWLSHQAASGYLAYDPSAKTFELPPEQAMVFADENSPANLLGAFDAVAAMMQNEALVSAAFKTGKGVSWSDQSPCLFCATARFFRPGYEAHLISEWLPSLEGVIAKLTAGATVADVGCGHGFSTVLMAKAFPNSRFYGFDFHQASVDQARAHAREHGVIENTVFERAMASEYPAREYDLVTFFDCLHDMGDPVGTALHVKETLKKDGTWMIVEPMAGDSLEENLNAVGRNYYAGSTMVCVPTSLDQPVGMALGAQAGFKRLTEVIRSGGFGTVRKASATQFNMIIEARA